MDPATRGDPESPLRWTSKSTRTLADELSAQGHRSARRTVAKLLHESGYSLQATRKTRKGGTIRTATRSSATSPRQVNAHRAGRDPVVSVDTKKKELVGDVPERGPRMAARRGAGAGQGLRLHRRGTARPSRTASTTSPPTPPGCRSAATTTPPRSPWRPCAGGGTRWASPLYPNAGRLLICADGGGSNGSRVRLWKVELAAFAAETGLTITVCHLPPGTSKWNKIEHRLFSHISMNWRGRPLVSHETIVQLIAATTTRTGLAVRAELDDRAYPKGIKISDEQMAALPLTRHDFHGDWNYTLKPK